MMHIIKNRPLVAGVLFFLGTFFLSPLIQSRSKGILILLFLGFSFTVILFSLFQKRMGKQHSFLCIFLLAASLALTSSYLYFDRGVGDWNEKSGTKTAAYGVVTEVEYFSQEESVYQVLLYEIDGTRKYQSAQLKTDYASALQEGDVFRANASFQSFEEGKWFCGDSSGACGILSVEESEDCQVIDKELLSWYFQIKTWNTELSLRLKNAIGGENGALAAAFLLGNRDFLGGKTTMEFRRSGISHLLALSGLHVSLILGGLELFLRKLRVPKVIRCILVSAFGVFYLFLTGCALSTLRAVIMVLVLYFSFLFHGSYDALTSLFTALFLILFTMPYAVMDVSLWLSFSAVFGILTFTPAVTDFLEKTHLKKRLPPVMGKIVFWLLTGLSTGLFANCLLLPVSYFFFGEISLLSIPATLVLSPILPVILLLSILTLVFPGLIPLTFLTNLSLELLRRFASLCAEPSFFFLKPYGTPILVLTIALAVSVLVLAVIPLKRKAWILLSILLLFAVLGTSFSQCFSPVTRVQVDYLEGYQWDLCILTAGQSAVLLDTGAINANPANGIREKMEENHCTEISDWLIFHFHSQTTSLIANLSGSYQIRRIYLPNPQTDTEEALAKRIIEEAKLAKIEVLEYADFQNEKIRVNSVYRDEEGSLLCSFDIFGQKLCYLGSFGNAQESVVNRFLCDTEYCVFGIRAGNRWKEKQKIDFSENVKLISFPNEKVKERFSFDRSLNLSEIIAEKQTFFIEQK